MASNGGAPENLMDLMDQAPAQPPGSSKKADKGTSKKSAPASSLSVDGVPPQAQLSKPAGATDAKKQKKPISYGQLARAVIELAETGDQKATQKQLVSSIFPKLSVFSTVDVQLVPAFLKLLHVEDRSTLRYVFYYLGRILGEVGTSSSAPQTPGTAGPQWEALGGSKASTGDKIELVNQVVVKLAEEAGKKDPALHGRRVAALKALAHAPPFLEAAMRKLAQAAFEILAQVNDGTKLKRARRGIFGRSKVDKETALRANLQYAALAALRRLPADPGNQQLLTYAAQGVGAVDPVAARHSLAILCSLAIPNPTGVATALSKMSKDGSISLGEQVQCPDVYARVYLARLSSLLLFAPSLARPDLQAQFGALLFKLILDPSTKVSLEALNCMVGSINGEGSPDARAQAWMLLQKASMIIENSGEEPKSGGKQKGAPTAAPVKTVEPVLSVAAQRLEYILRSESRPALHAACRAVAEWGRARAYAGNYADEPSAPVEKVEAPVDTGLFANLDFSTPEEIAEREAAKAKGPEASRNLLEGKRLTRSQLGAILAPLMEAVRSTVACECVYTRCAAIKAMIWMQTESDSAEELQSTIAGELADPVWPASLLNELLLQIHSRFKATPELAGTLLKITNSWATLVPHKVDVDVLQMLWKSCLVGCGPPGKHIALEAVGTVLDLPPPKPPGSAKPSQTPAEKTAAAAASDPKGATALQRLVQAAVWFLGENANYAASEYAWEPQSAAGQMLMMMEGEKMVMAAGVRNPILAAALSRLQRCAVASSWEVRVVAAQAIITVALRSGEPYRLQCYEFLTSLLRGERLKHKLQEQQGLASSGEDEGGSGSGLANVVAPMLRMLDEIYTAQDQFVRDLRQHENTKEDWTEAQLESLYNTHDTLLHLVSLFCFVPRSKYLPLGPTSADLIEQYKLAHNIQASAASTPNDPAVATGIAGLSISGPGMYIDTQPSPVPTENGGPGLVDDPWAGTPPGMDLVNDFLGGAVPKVIGSVGDDKGPGGPPEPDAPINYDDLWASTLLEERGGATSDSDDESVVSSTSDASSMQTSGGIFERPGSGSFKVQAFSPLGFASPPREGGASTSSPFSGPITSDSPRVVRRSLDWSTSASSPTAARSGNALFDSVSASQTRGPSHTRGLSTLSEASAGGSGKTVFGQNGEPAKMGKAIYDFEAGGADEVDLKVGDVVQIQYEVEGWYHVTKVDAIGQPSGLAPVLYIEITQ